MIALEILVAGLLIGLGYLLGYSAAKGQLEAVKEQMEKRLAEHESRITDLMLDLERARRELKDASPGDRHAEPPRLAPPNG